MSVYHGENPGITPVLANDNLSLDAAASEQCYITEVSASGESTATTAMRTRFTRSASGATPVAGNVQKHRTNSPTNLVNFVTSWTTQPTLTAGSLLHPSWNSHGGVILWKATPGDDEWEFIGASQFSCRNAVGLGVSSYGIRWREA